MRNWHISAALAVAALLAATVAAYRVLPRAFAPSAEFGPGMFDCTDGTDPRQLHDREAKLHVNTAARCLLTKTKAGKHYGVVTPKIMGRQARLPYCFSALAVSFSLLLRWLLDAM